MRVAYIRAGAADPDEAQQLDCLKKYGIEKWFVENASSRSLNRPRLQEMLGFLRSGDTVFVRDFSRLAGSLRDLVSLLSLFESTGVYLVSEEEKADSRTPAGREKLSMVRIIQEFEQKTRRERQQEGITLARAAGKYRGRRPIVIDHFSEYYERYRRHLVTKSQLARELGISRPTLNKLIAEYELQKEAAP